MELYRIQQARVSALGVLYAHAHVHSECIRPQGPHAAQLGQVWLLSWRLPDIAKGRRPANGKGYQEGAGIPPPGGTE